jgi:hypothetical protein
VKYLKKYQIYNYSMMNEEITWFKSKLIPNFKEQNIDPKLVIEIIEEGLLELKDEGFEIDVK